MDRKRTYTMDEYFIAIFKVTFIRRKTPSSPLELCFAKLSMVFAFCVGILIIDLLLTIFIHIHQGLDWKNSELPEWGASAVCCLITLYREWVFISKKKQINGLLKKLENIFPLTKEDQQNYNLDIHAKAIIRKNNSIKLIISYSCIALVLFPIFKSIYKWLTTEGAYPLLYPLMDQNNIFGETSIVGCTLAYSYRVVAIFGGSYIWYKEDMVIGTFVAQLCMHYRYLGDRLQRLDARKEELLKNVIRYQYTLDNICDDINNIFGMSNFFAFTIVTIGMSMYLFSMVHSIDMSRILSLVLNIFGLISTVYLRCRTGEDLLDASSNLLFSIYDQNWYEGTPKYRRTLVILMLKASRPMELKSYKFKTISMEYFKEIVVSTYEIFMFFVNFNKK